MIILCRQLNGRYISGKGYTSICLGYSPELNINCVIGSTDGFCKNDLTKNFLTSTITQEEVLNEYAYKSTLADRMNELKDGKVDFVIDTVTGRIINNKLNASQYIPDVFGKYVNADENILKINESTVYKYSSYVEITGWKK